MVSTWFSTFPSRRCWSCAVVRNSGSLPNIINSKSDTSNVRRSFVIFSGGYHEHLVTFRWLTQILTDLLWKYRQPRKPPWTHYLEMKEESLKRHGNEDMLNVWLYRFQTKRISTPWTGIINHVVSYSRSVWDGLRCNRWIKSNDLLRKRHLLTRTESHKKALTRPRVKWRKASESAYPTNVLESIVLLLSLLNKVEDPGIDTCPENTKRNISSSLHYAAHRLVAHYRASTLTVSQEESRFRFRRSSSLRGAPVLLPWSLKLPD
ncbi:hypothetical protein YC2023_011559 [Brassica napus]